ncbi:MAG: MotA/TolQ/ExbB proton channel family protein [Lachnospiraceae bacterium]|nr:MotA/TolQ/ExbB proton channel family protein [Lachnospiraceae bacterium]
MNVLALVSCMVIIFFGAVIFFFMLSNRNKLVRVQISLYSVVMREGEREEEVDANGKLFVRKAEAEAYDLASIEEIRRDFNTAYADYVRNGQLTALLPLCGILGTVIGLIASSGTSDITGLMAGLGTAMWTTAAGLVLSILLKGFDAWSIGRKVNEIDADFAAKDAIIQRQTLIKEARAVRRYGGEAKG